MLFNLEHTLISIWKIALQHLVSKNNDKYLFVTGKINLQTQRLGDMYKILGTKKSVTQILPP